MIRRILQTERLGPLPIINHFIRRIGLEEAFDRHVPSDPRCAVPHAHALGVLLRSIIVEREPIYPPQMRWCTYVTIALGALSTDCLMPTAQHCSPTLSWRLVSASEFADFHNDSTTIFCGAYHAASGRKIRGRTAPAITYGFSKGHRPDLKQLLFILTMSADGNTPSRFAAATAT
jgi:hypothetical protein